MRMLIDDLLLLARADEQRLVMGAKEVSVNDVADAEVNSSATDASCAIHSVDHPGANTRRLGGDLAVIRNLLDNAVRHADVTRRGLRRPSGPRQRSSPSVTMARVSRPKIGRGCSNASCDWTPIGPAAAEAPASGWRSSPKSLPRTAAPSRSKTESGRGTTMQVSLPQHTNR